MTNSPTVNVGSATLTENNAGTYRYISGVPYYNSGSPTLTLAGVTIDDLTGQAYRDTSNVFEIASGSNYESTSGSIISTCLLYTSPSPRDKRQSRMPSSA